MLLPDEDELQTIDNQHAVEELEASGDTLETPRPVDHFVLFETRETCQVFQRETAALGFEKVEDAGDAADAADAADSRIEVRIRRVDDVDPVSINEVTLLVLRCARELGGEYDGWTTEVVPTPAAGRDELDDADDGHDSD